MRGKTPAGDLAPLDLEIEATCKRNNIERKRKVLQDMTANSSGKRILSSESSSSFPMNLRESKVGASEANMANDQPQRVTLEDYSISTVLQFFTSIARPDVQATNISYPHSLIQLIQGNILHGMPNEDPYAHLETYIEICNTIRIAGVHEDAIRLNLF